MSESEDSEHEERSLNIVNMPDSDELSLYSVNTSDSEDFEHEDISQNASSNDNYEPEIQVNPYTIYPRPLNFNIPPELQFETHYDRSLTAAHQYLGDGLREVSGRTVYEEGFVHTIPIIFLKLNLLPGQILPIIAHSSDIKLILKYAIFRNRSFGVSYKLNRNKPTYGTIAEIYEHSVDIETTESFQIKAMGHQRYEILQIHSFPESCEQSLALGKIRIIPEITLVHPYNKLCLNPNKRHSSHDDKCRKKDMWQTQWPSWVYKQYDVYELASRLSKKVKMLYKDVKISDDPNLLSFQVTKLGIFSQEQVSELLGTESTNIRLQFELLYWNKIQSMQKFMCARSGCGIPICNMSNVFPMSPEGPQGTYCNSWGKIHDMITVTELDEDLNVTTVGTPSTECCWFPGYQWTIIMCPNCHSHLGWNYLVEDNLPLTPKLFYGLCVSAITSIKDYLVPNRERLEEINDGEMLITF